MRDEDMSLQAMPIKPLAAIVALVPQGTIPSFGKYIKTEAFGGNGLRFAEDTPSQRHKAAGPFSTSVTLNTV